MGETTRAPAEVITLPQGGGAVRGIGEKFSPDLQTGTGNFTVPIAVPAGRRGLEPKLDLGYSTGGGNGHFGLGWGLTVPGISRATSHGVPTYDDARDRFILSGSEDLVAVESLSAVQMRYQPRTEGLYAQIVYHRDPASGQDYWEVATKDGLVSRYGSIRPGGAAGQGWRDPATIVDPDDAGHIFAWKLTETTDLLGNVVVYSYGADEGVGGGHRWRQPVLETIRYVDYQADDGTTRFLATVRLDYEDRPDAGSNYTAGFEIRTSKRCRAISTSVHTETEQPVRRYDLRYQQDAYNGVSLLTEVEVVGFDDDGAEQRDLPPLSLGYTQFAPDGRRFHPITGSNPPAASLARGDYELVDLTGDGLPDVLGLNGVARYWRNLGGGTFDRPRSMTSSPAGLRLADPGVQLLDADGDGRADLLVTTPELAGFFPLRFGAQWARFRPYRDAPSFNLEDPQVRLLDLTGNGVTDALHAGSRLTCFFNDPKDGWTGPRPARSAAADGLPDLSFTDHRVRFADMTGDGLQDLVLLHDRAVEYWPNLGHGRWGGRTRMTSGPQLPYGYDPQRLLLGDVDGDGLADLVYVGAGQATVWINRSGNGWSDPITVLGCPAPGELDSLRITDLLGTGTGGVLWSRDAPSAGRPAMHFLDLTGGGKPRLLNEIDNHIGAVTRVAYAPSTRDSLADAARPATRWRTPLPFVVPVVSRVETIDAVSGGKLTTEYHYRHGYWDGVEREFRGFGCVEQVDTETFDDYHDVGLHPDTSFTPVGLRSFCPPTLTRTWFHLGPVDAEDDSWAEVDYRAEYWEGDPNLLAHSERVNQFLRGLSDPAGRSDRRARRDALRVLRGRVLRTEFYALDGSALQGRPYTVTEHAYDLREEAPGGEPGRQRIFAAFEVAQRTTQWERGDDPMTGFTFTADHDAYGQPRRQTTVAPPRRSACCRPITAAVNRTFVPDELRILATHTRTGYAEPDSAAYLHDRVARVRTFELVVPPPVNESAPEDVGLVLADQLRAAEAVRQHFDALSASDVRMIGDVVHHYDGDAYSGLSVGQVGRYGLLTRSETLVFTEAILNEAYGDRRPVYLGGADALPAGAPADFGADLGYRQGPDGWYADTTRQAYDVQLPASANRGRGLVLGIQDSLRHETRVTPDAYWLLPAMVRDPAGLETTAEYDYRLGGPRRVIDPNGHATNYRYHPLGLLAAVFLEGRNGEGGSAAQPEISYSYDLAAQVSRGQPISVRTTRRVWHARANVSDEVIESLEYSDGLGRLVQQRAQADDLAFGDSGDDVGLLVPDAGGVPRPVPGQTNGPAAGNRVLDRVVVSGWQVYDNKGHVVESYEPFFDRGWEYQPEEEAKRGRPVTTFYDPRGQAVRAVRPDGAQSRTVFGTPADLANPDSVEPSPWTVTAYDENDLAPVSTGPDGLPLGNSAPADHHFTPTTTVLDGLGRTICRLARKGQEPATGWQAARTGYDTRGNAVAVLDQLGRTAFRYVYDLANRPLRIQSIDAGVTMSALDALGNVAHTWDARGCVALRTYDGLNRLAAVYARDVSEGTLTQREHLVYGDGGIPEQPAGDRDAARTANRLGRLWQYHDEAGLVTAESYTFTGNVTEQVRRVISDAAIAAAEPVGWTANWALASADAALDPTDYRTSSRYDALNRVVTIDAPTDVSGHRAGIVPAYSRSGALRSITVDGTEHVRLLAHNARGQRVLLAYASATPDSAGPGMATRYAYDPDTFRLTRLRTERMARTGDTWAGAGAPLQDLTYSYDLVGNVTTIEERTTGCGVAGTVEGRDRLVRTFTYDAFYRLVSATGRACADLGELRPLDDTPRCGSLPASPTQGNAPDVTTGYRETYAYDPAGNLLDLLYQVTTGATQPRWHRLFGMGNQASHEWVTAPNNRLTSVENASVMTRFGFDAAGNVESENQDRSYIWDHAGRLIHFRIHAGTGTSVAARYFYGADGLRVKKWVRRGDTPTLDESIVYIGNLAERHRWSKAGGGENSVLHVLDGTSRIALIRAGPPHPDDTGPAVRYELVDHVGNASLTVDATGAWTNREEYFPYGETSFGSFSRKRYRFTGKERDEESGLSYHCVRYYSPPLCRWISCDQRPAEHLTPYAYGGSSPLRFIDPSGAAPAEVESAAGPQPSQPELNLVRGPYSNTEGHHSQMSSAFPDPATRVDPFRGAVTTTSQTQGALKPVANQPSIHQAISNVQNAAGDAAHGRLTGTREVGLINPTTGRPMVQVAVVDNSGTLAPTPSTWWEQAKSFFGWRGGGAPRAQALRLTLEDVAERQVLAAEETLRTGKYVSPLPTRAPGGQSTPQRTVPVSPGGLETAIPGWTQAAITATTKWLSATTLSLGTITQALQAWNMAEELEERGVINTQFGPMVSDPAKAFRNVPDYTPVWDPRFPQAGIHGYIIGGQYVPSVM